MRVLAISPHADDAEFGAGATIARLVREGHEVRSFAFSDARPEFGVDTDDSRAAHVEYAAAAEVLGIKAECGCYPRRILGVYRQRVLDELIRLRDGVDLVLAPSRFDTHQDHAVVAQEVVRAFRRATVLGYVLPWNCPTVAKNAWREVSEDDAARKIEAIACYTSQAGKPYARPEAIRAGLVTAGLQAGVPLAEAFEVIRWLA